MLNTFEHPPPSPSRRCSSRGGSCCVGGPSARLRSPPSPASCPAAPWGGEGGGAHLKDATFTGGYNVHGHRLQMRLLAGATFAGGCNVHGVAVRWLVDATSMANPMWSLEGLGKLKSWEGSSQALKGYTCARVRGKARQRHGKSKARQTHTQQR